MTESVSDIGPVIGEASKRLGSEFCDKYPDTPWSDMARMRDKLIHHYFGIDYKLVWNVVEEKIPELQLKIRAILRKESK